MARTTDPAALMARRGADQAARVALAEDRWGRFQAATRRRYASLAGGLPPLIQRLMARAKPPGRRALIATSHLWLDELEAGLGSAGALAPDVWTYVKAGPSPDLQPRALFDQAWYLDKVRWLSRSPWPPLAHYLIEGHRQNQAPHPLLDPDVAERTAGARLRGPTPLHRFLAQGAAAGANPHTLFDTRFYVGRCDAVAESGENPLIHYLRTGWRDGLDPHPLFAGDWYLATHPEARAAGIAPLLHYVTAGAAAGLDPHPLFDTAAYLEQTPGRIATDPLSDFIRTGAAAGRAPCAHFHPAYYLHRTGGAARARENPLLHYLTVGAFEGLWPAPNFDETTYFAAHPDAAASPLTGLDHWARRGAERPDLKVLRPAAGASAQDLYDHYQIAAWPDPVTKDIAAYAAVRATLPAPRVRAAEPRVLALRRTTAPDWLEVARANDTPRLPVGGLHDPGEPAVLAKDERLAARYGVTLVHEIAGPEDARRIATASQPYAISWTGQDDPAAAAEVLRPLLTSPLALRLTDAPLLIVPVDAKRWRELGYDARTPTAFSLQGLAGPPVTAPAISLVPATGDRPGAFQAWLEAALTHDGVVLVDAWNHWARCAVIAPSLTFGHDWLEAVANAYDADLLEP